MKKRPCAPTVPIAAVLLLTVGAAARAADYWSPAELAARAGETTAARASTLPPPEDGRGTIDYMDQFALAVQFIATMQVADTTLPRYGGVQEGEAQPWVVQTDNTTESIWMWSHWTALTGDSTYLPNIEAAWTYVMNYPAYNEEGGSGEFGYYRIYNCGWAMAAESEYRRVFGDSTYLAYGDSCASYVIRNPLNLYGAPPNDPLMGMVTGWAAGNLHAYGLSTGVDAWRTAAAGLGADVRTWAEGDPTLRLGGWEWAMSGGAAFWGILESWFREHPDGAPAWAAAWDDHLQIYVDSGDWQNAWNLWFALGHYASWGVQGNLREKAIHRRYVDHLIGTDTDGDGGIAPSEATGNFNDQSWVTNYLGFMGLDRLRIRADLVIVPDTATVAPGGTVGFDAVVASNRSTDLLLEGWTEVDLADGSEYPGNPVLGPVPFTLPANGAASLSFSQGVPAGAPAGIYTVRGAVGGWPDPVVDSDERAITVTGGR